MMLLNATWCACYSLPPFLKKQQGITLEYCFQLLNNPKEAVAIRVFAMTVLYNLTLQEPDLAHELYDSIEMHMEGALPGYKSRGGRILELLNKKFF